jgi:hypothetical protein
VRGKPKENLNNKEATMGKGKGLLGILIVLLLSPIMGFWDSIKRSGGSN